MVKNKRLSSAVMPEETVINDLLVLLLVQMCLGIKGLGRQEGYGIYIPYR